MSAVRSIALWTFVGLVTIVALGALGFVFVEILEDLQLEWRPVR